jgi:predicted esterase/LysM repeat protein
MCYRFAVMRTLVLVLCFLAVSILAPSNVQAKERTHTVGPGHTLGKIAKRYHISIDELVKANNMTRRDSIKPGQKLVIPDGSSKNGKATDSAKDEDDLATDKEEEASSDSDDETEKADKEDAKKADGKPVTRSYGSDGMRVLEVPGHGDAFYYEPTGPGRKGLKPVIMYLHGRGGHPAQDCRRWARVARRFGWLVCPSGPSAHGDGRDWANNWAAGQRISVATVQAMRKKFGRRVQLYGNTLIGFSEGAYVALNVGVREARTFNRWLVLAGKTTYFGGAGMEELKKHGRSLKRVYLITGELDDVVEGTKQLRDWLQSAKVAVRVSMPKDMGHEVALDRKSGMYSAALAWLDRGVGGKPERSASTSSKAASRER